MKTGWGWPAGLAASLALVGEERVEAWRAEGLPLEPISPLAADRRAA